jgi:hypothetical protein
MARLVCRQFACWCASTLGELDGLTYKAAANKVAELLAALGFSEKTTSLRLRDQA